MLVHHVASRDDLMRGSFIKGAQKLAVYFDMAAVGVKAAIELLRIALLLVEALPSETRPLPFVFHNLCNDIDLKSLQLLFHNFLFVILVIQHSSEFLTCAINSSNIVLRTFFQLVQSTVPANFQF